MKTSTKLLVCAAALAALAGCPTPTTPPNLGRYPLRIRVVGENVSVQVTQIGNGEPLVFPVSKASPETDYWWFLGNVDPGRFGISGSYEPLNGPWDSTRLDFYLEVTVNEDGSYTVDKARGGDATAEAEANGNAVAASIKIEVNGNGNVINIGSGNAQGGQDTVNNGDQNATTGGGDVTGGTNEGGNANGGTNGGTGGGNTDIGDDDDGDADPIVDPCANVPEAHTMLEVEQNGIWYPLEGNYSLVGRTLHLRIRNWAANGEDTGPLLDTFPAELRSTFRPTLEVLVRDQDQTPQTNDDEKVVWTLALTGVDEFTFTIPDNATFWQAPYYGFFYIRGIAKVCDQTIQIPGKNPVLPVFKPGLGAIFNTLRN